MKIIKNIGLALIVIFSITGQALAEAGAPPLDVVKNSIGALLGEASKNLEQVKADKDYLKSLIDQYLIPNASLAGMSRKLLGKNWKAASKEQKIKFVKAFKDQLVSYTARAFGYYNGQEIEYLPAPDTKGKSAATVRLRVIQDGASPIKVDFKMNYLKKKKEWKVTDFSVEGISLIKSKAAEYDRIISKSGLDYLIQDMERRNAAGDVDEEEIKIVTPAPAATKAG